QRVGNECHISLVVRLGGLGDLEDFRGRVVGIADLAADAAVSGSDTGDPVVAARGYVIDAGAVAGRCAVLRTWTVGLPSAARRSSSRGVAAAAQAEHSPTRENHRAFCDRGRVLAALQRRPT